MELLLKKVLNDTEIYILIINVVNDRVTNSKPIYLEYSSLNSYLLLILFIINVI